MTDPLNIQAQDTLQTILDEKLCDEKQFQELVVNYRLLKLVKGGRLIISKDESGIKVDPSIWPRGREEIFIEAIKKNP